MNDFNKKSHHSIWGTLSESSYSAIGNPFTLEFSAGGMKSQNVTSPFLKSLFVGFEIIAKNSL